MGQNGVFEMHPYICDQLIFYKDVKAMEPIEVFLTNNDKIIGYPYGKRKL
jgi:hypothetical protein